MNCNAGRNRYRSAFTLLEVLIATAVTLALMVGLAQIFRVLGNSITQGRASLEINNRLRSVVHRIRTDLDHLTLIPRPPIHVGAGVGYLKIYDGPLSDAHFAADTSMNRFGDLDDILSATVSSQNSWFHGKVPKFVYEKREPTSVSELSDFVTISSKYAELVVFVEPDISRDNNLSRDPTSFVLDPTKFEDQDSNGFPDRFKLHYRLLLIRPDLNMGYGSLPGYPNYDTTSVKNPVTTARAMIAGPEEIGGTALPVYKCDMYRIHQYCDLSVKRVRDPSDGLAGSLDYVAANSLEDLAQPANRFAHYEAIYPGSLKSMPLLALGPGLATYGTPLSTLNTGFLHPAFTLLGGRQGEDILATDVLAFDLKVFDPSAPVLGHVGRNNVNDAAAAGTDDVVLTPNDPGYFPFGVTGLTSNPQKSFRLSYGEFVDVDWMGKSFRDLGTTFVTKGTVFSGVSSNVVQLTSVPTSLRKSGLVIFNGSGVLQEFQPSFDSFTDAFEMDGILQSGTNATLQTIGTSTSADTGTDGIDNNGDGIADDVEEKETSAPFVTDLRGIQISVRLEDKATKQFKQMSTVKQFVSQ